jgi:hypothetical protein
MKNIVAAIIGIAYAVLYGLWTAIATGGGHVNFIWFWMFFTIEMFGLYFPLMTVLAVNLRSQLTRMLFGCLITANVIASSLMIYGWVNEPPSDQMSDFERSLRVNGYGGLMFCGMLHFLPAGIFYFLLFKAAYFPSNNKDGKSESLSLFIR